MPVTGDIHNNNNNNETFKEKFGSHTVKTQIHYKGNACVSRKLINNNNNNNILNVKLFTA